LKCTLITKKPREKVPERSPKGSAGREKSSEKGDGDQKKERRQLTASLKTTRKSKTERRVPEAFENDIALLVKREGCNKESIKEEASKKNSWKGRALKTGCGKKTEGNGGRKKSQTVSAS